MFLIERGSEKKFFEKGIREAGSGRGSVLLVTAPDGCGKTELLHQFADHARSEQMLTLIANCFHAERHFPLGIMEQLLTQSELPGTVTDEVRTLLESTKDIPEADIPEMSLRFSEGFHRLFGRLSALHPLVLCIDDVHDIDRISLQCLLHLIRRIRNERIVVILTEREDMSPGHSLILGDLLRRPHVRRFSLAPLSRAGTERLLAHHLGTAPPEPVGAEFYLLTGGNPLLLHALIQDVQKGGPAGADLVPGRAYQQAVVELLRRHEPHVLRMAQGRALFSGSSPNQLLEHSFCAGPGAADHALRILGQIGLVREQDFRHPQIGTALLANLALDERAVLHRRAAQLLYEQGAPAVQVARHLIAGGATEALWSAPLLEEAVDAALAENDTEFAKAAFDYATKQFAGTGLTHALKAKLLELTWGSSPEATVRNLPPLLAELRAGRLPARYAFSLTRNLVWYGQGARAGEVLEALAARAALLDKRSATEAEVIRAWLAVTQPGSAEPEPAEAVPADGDLRLRAFRMLRSALRQGAAPAAAAEVEQVLRYAEFGAQSLEAAFALIALLIHSEQPDKAITWCDKVSRETATAARPEFRAQLLALRAQALLRQGDLATAYHHARQSITVLPPAGWGVAVGFPLAVLIEVCLDSGREDEARGYVSHPVPQEMYQTRFGLHFVHARGLHHLAAGQVEAAAADFDRCGQLMAAWQLDSPAFISWRIGAAEARRRVGDHDDARHLIADQLARLSRDQPRAWGVSLTAMAELTQPAERHAVLAEATEMLNRSGDHVQLARTLTKLGHAYQQLGEDGTARTMFQRAQDAVREHEADVPQALLDQPEPAFTGAVEADLVLDALSYAEQRVAALAAQGATNRQISFRLRVTVSTVEQHLTRIYRKLGVKHRKDLAGLLRSRP